MTDGYQATAINGNRFDPDGRETWIKIETVVYNATTIAYDTQDITQDILSLGVTDPAQSTGLTLIDSGYTSSNGNDTFDLALQRFALPGPAIPTHVCRSGSTLHNQCRRYNYVKLELFDRRRR